MKPLKEQFEILRFHNIKSVVFEFDEKEYNEIEKQAKTLVQNVTSIMLETPVGNQQHFTFTMYGIKATYLLKPQTT